MSYDSLSGICIISSILGLKCSCQATSTRKQADICQNLLWQSMRRMYLAYLLTFFLASYLIYLHSFFVAEVRLGSLSSSSCCSGLAGTTAIARLQLRSGGDHSDPGLAVRVHRGPLRSRAWQLRSGGEHSDLGVAVRVRRGPLRSRACSWGRRRRRRRRRAAYIKSNNPPDRWFLFQSYWSKQLLELEGPKNANQSTYYLIQIHQLQGAADLLAIPCATMLLRICWQSHARPCHMNANMCPPTHAYPHNMCQDFWPEPILLSGQVCFLVYPHFLLLLCIHGNCSCWRCYHAMFHNCIIRSGFWPRTWGTINQNCPRTWILSPRYVYIFYIHQSRSKGSWWDVYYKGRRCYNMGPRESFFLSSRK